MAGTYTARRAEGARYVGAIRDAGSRYRATRAGGYTTAEDDAAAERTRSRGTASAARSGQIARTHANRSAVARGLSGASAAALQQRAGDVELAGREEAFRAGEDVRYDAFNRNKDFEQRKLTDAFGAETQALGTQLEVNMQALAQKDAQSAAFWNSIMQVAPIAASLWAGPAAPLVAGGAAGAAKRAATSAATYQPAVSSIRQPR